MVVVEIRNPAMPCLWLLIILAAISMVTGGDVGTAGSCQRSPSMSLLTYCESWRTNVETHNIRGFAAVPSECSEHIGKYMVESLQYESDVQRAAEEAELFLSNKVVAGEDERDAWVFDVDDTLLSTLPYFRKHHYGAALWCGGDNSGQSRASLQKWLESGEAPALEHMLDLYFKIKRKGLKIFIISSRRGSMREVTVNNLLKAGYSGWAELILRCGQEASSTGVQGYKEAQRKKLQEQGYRIWGIVGDQWSSLVGSPNAKRTFKLPNPMYYAS